MIVQSLEKQKIEEVTEYKLLNLDHVVPNEIEDQDRQPCQPTVLPLNKIEER